MAFTTVNKGFTTKNITTYDLQYDTKTGAVQIIEQNAPPGTKPIYEDGKWLTTPAASAFNTSEQTQIHQQVVASIQAAYNATGGVNSGNTLPQWASKNFSTGQPGQNSTNPAAATSGTQGATSNGGSGNIFQALLNPIPTFKNNAVNGGKFGVKNEKDLFGDSSLLTYPKDLLTSKQDHFVISMFEYKPVYQEQLFGGKKGALSILESGLQSSGALEKRVGTVYLPMPQNVSDSNAVSWAGESMSNLASAVTANVLGDTGSYAVAGLVGGIGGLAFGGQIGGAAAGLMRAKTLADLAGSFGNESMKTLLTSDISSKIVKANGFNVESESLLLRGAGIVPNSNTELLFNNVVLREFSFAYRLSPRSEAEAITVRRIIRFFKQGMAAKKISGKSGQASFFLGTPNVFKLEYRSGPKGIDAVNKFKTCALKAFTCNYTPEGVWAAYEAGQPISTVITFQFQELEAIYDTDYQEDNIFAGRKDLSSINNNSVGY